MGQQPRTGDPLLAARLRRRADLVAAMLDELYGDDSATLLERVLCAVERSVADRDPALRDRDLQREADPRWYQRPDQVGYVCYVDLFAGTLSSIVEHIPYLRDLGVTYLHLMPLLRPRDGENDGGYAVSAYDEVDPRLGTMDDLRQLASALHAAGISLCIDVVVNHTAAEHPWAVAARAGDPEARARYHFFPDRTMPDRFERTLREVFPAFAPGNFTWLADAEQWVWTTFHEFQWDLDWSNPEVFAVMFEAILGLVDVGVDVLRLDAVPFLWKREGTSCENLPQVHTLLCALRELVAIAAPSTIFKAEAIVPPDLLTAYLGSGSPERNECELAYNNQLMVLLWSSLATGDARLMTTSLQRMATIPDHACWVNYVRCHDDIGWAITDEDAASVGWSGPTHRGFLNEFYSGGFDTSFARGEVFQFNPLTGDGRISGSAASLCGIESALISGDLAALEESCARLELIYATVFAFTGIPLVYMGDELGLLNDQSYLDDPSRADDNRWMHRPAMDWSAAERRRSAGTVEHRLFTMVAGLAAARAGVTALHGSVSTRVADVGDPSVLCLVRGRQWRGRFTMLANFGRLPVRVSRDVAGVAGDTVTVVRSARAAVDVGEVTIDPLGYLWLTDGG
jgi:amylosucrase